MILDGPLLIFRGKQHPKPRQPRSWLVIARGEPDPHLWGTKSHGPSQIAKICLGSWKIVYR